jgi:hypothetical protein
LRDEFEKIKSIKSVGREHKLLEFLDKLARLKFLDPACGCGNFLVVSYRELRKLEIEALAEYLQMEKVLNIDLMVRVNVDQFYGIEIEEFPARIAQTALWLMDHLMNMEASKRFGKYITRIPLAASPNIVIGNALATEHNWEKIVSKYELSYILGNPPFAGKKEQSDRQKKEVREVFYGVKGAGDLDYVACWYKKSADYIQGTDIEAAFVSTNSICQGEQAPVLWPYLMNNGCRIKINFAHQTFKWSNEAKGKASVHCVIIGFGMKDRTEKSLYHYIKADGEPTQTKASQINAYLTDSPSVFIQNRARPLCLVPDMCYGSMPIDHERGKPGNLILTENEAKELIKAEPLTKQMIRPYYGGEEFINGIRRYCLWLVDVPPEIISQSKLVKERIERTRRYREMSKSCKDSNLTPALFAYIRQPASDYLLVPKVSSERRTYIPIGFMKKKNIASGSTLIVPKAGLYEFGILTSGMHMAWMRTVCGRMKSDYQYSATLVYNNFPWPSPTKKQKTAIEENAQSILNARAQFPKATFAVLYDPLTMPAVLLKAHQRLDKAVEAAYGKTFSSDADRVAHLFYLYQTLTDTLTAPLVKKVRARKK